MAGAGGTICSSITVTIQEMLVFHFHLRHRGFVIFVLITHRYELFNNYFLTIFDIETLFHRLTWKLMSLQVIVSVGAITVNSVNNGFHTGVVIIGFREVTVKNLSWELVS